MTRRMIEMTVQECPPHAPGIYFLFDGDELVYVGQSRSNIRGRIAAHMGDERDKQFTHYGWIVLPVDEVQAAEDDAILRYRPRHNAKFPNKKKRIAWENSNGTR